MVYIAAVTMTIIVLVRRGGVVTMMMVWIVGGFDSSCHGRLMLIGRLRFDCVMIIRGRYCSRDITSIIATPFLHYSNTGGKGHRTLLSINISMIEKE